MEQLALSLTAPSFHHPLVTLFLPPSFFHNEAQRCTKKAHENKCPLKFCIRIVPGVPSFMRGVIFVHEVQSDYTPFYG